ncbi:hypothetical protein WN51_02274 [Melipona quadrifasciata]|uniref:Uncharacterized protein n=1 Tax=Melipona quadrifasciata TaxID=166423 RepID=A0A0M8ZTJ7_9HYME|nr:hypothetical protein WN51_02274 [Melipona quadrifasciata]
MTVARCSSVKNTQRPQDHSPAADMCTSFDSGGQNVASNLFFVAGHRYTGIRRCFSCATVHRNNVILPADGDELLIEPIDFSKPGFREARAIGDDTLPWLAFLAVAFVRSDFHLDERQDRPRRRFAVIVPSAGALDRLPIAVGAIKSFSATRRSQQTDRVYLDKRIDEMTDNFRSEKKDQKRNETKKKEEEKMKEIRERRRGKAKEEETSATSREFTNLDASTGLFRLRPITSISLYRALLLSNEIEALETGRTAGRKPTIDVHAP